MSNAAEYGDHSPETAITQPGSDNTVVALITGASRGLGRAMAQGLLAAGHRVVAMARPGSEAALHALSGPRGDHRDRLVCVTGDICSDEDCRAVLDLACKQFGRVQVLVNNAALGMDQVGSHVTKRKFFEIDSATWRRIIDTNINGTFNISKVVVPHLVDEGWGRVVNISTNFKTMQRAGFCPYGPSKAAVEALTVSWAQELVGTGVTVNALLPGAAADTDMIPRDEFSDRERLLGPQTMAPPLLWLLSRASDGITGQRFIAKDWLPGAAPEEALKSAAAKAGW